MSTLSLSSAPTADDAAGARAADPWCLAGVGAVWVKGWDRKGSFNWLWQQEVTSANKPWGALVHESWEPDADRGMCWIISNRLTETWNYIFRFVIMKKKTKTKHTHTQTHTHIAMHTLSTLLLWPEQQNSSMFGGCTTVIMRTQCCYQLWLAADHCAAETMPAFTHSPWHETHGQSIFAVFQGSLEWEVNAGGMV